MRPLLRRAFALVALMALFASCDAVEEITGGEDDRFDADAELARLAGDWVLYDTNNSNVVAREIRVSGSSGTLTLSEGSSFSVGDVKWRAITAVDVGRFEHEELGSDDNYYPGTLTLTTDTTLDVAVGNAGAGNAQAWARKGTGGVSEALPPEALPCDYFQEDRTLPDRSTGVDYTVADGCVMDTTADVVLEAGVTLAFGENAGLGVYDAGSISAVGTSTAPVVLQGTTTTKGWWRGIHVESDTDRNRLEFVRVRDAGRNYVYCCNDAATLLLKGGRLALRNVTFEAGAAYGLVVRQGARLTAAEALTVTGHDDLPARLDVGQAAALDGDGSSFRGNASDRVELTGRVREAATLPDLDVPYYVDAVMDVTQPLTVEPGVEIAFGQDAGLGIFDDGALDADGRASRSILFRAASSAWRGIHIETADDRNVLDHVTVEGAGSNYVYCCNQPASLFLKDGTAAVTNTTLRDGASYGIYAGRTFAFRAYEGNAVTGHGEAPLYAPMELLSALDGAGSSYAGNADDFVRIYNSNVDDATTVRALDVPYRLDGTVIDVTAPLTVEAGVEVAVDENGGLGVYDNGELQLNGTAAAPVVFRGAERTQGFWRGIHSETNRDNVVRHTRLLDAGSNYVYCCNAAAALLVKRGRLTLEDSELANSGGCGLYVDGSATVTEGSNTYGNNADGDVCD